MVSGKKHSSLFEDDRRAVLLASTRNSISWNQDSWDQLCIISQGNYRKRNRKWLFCSQSLSESTTFYLQPTHLHYNTACPMLSLPTPPILWVPSIFALPERLQTPLTLPHHLRLSLFPSSHSTYSSSPSWKAVSRWIGKFSLYIQCLALTLSSHDTKSPLSRLQRPQFLSRFGTVCRGLIVCLKA